MSNQRTGQRGEAAAKQYLEQRGWQFVAANVTTRFGELDLVMRYQAVLVFVEVKTRRGEHAGDPAEAVTPAKLRHTVAAAQQYLTDTAYEGAWQVDVVAINDDGIRHIPNVTM